MAVRLHRLADLDAVGRRALLSRTEENLTTYLEAVKPLIAAVRDQGDAALCAFAARFDGAQLTAAQLRVSEAEFDAAFARVSPQVITSIEYAIDNIRRFHERQLPERFWLDEIRPGSFAGERFTPIPSVACYVPRGKGSFPSVLMMTAIPAVVAGVPRTIVLTPPDAQGQADAASLVAARLVGIDEVYKVGGAQAVTAAAFGTATVPKVAKIVGPGSPYYIAAKRLLADHIDVSFPAGPSEAIVFADAHANGALAGLDLIIESEHGDDSSAFLVTASEAVAQLACEAIPHFWAKLGATRAGYSQTVLSGPRGGVVLADSEEAALAFINDYAPEHLLILAEDPMDYLGRIHHAGEILLGHHTPMTLANFVIGPNNVLPTSGAAITASPLSVFDYLKRSTVARVTARGYSELAHHAGVLATYEGFDGHALAVSALRQQVMANPTGFRDE